jgi:hypothetical protein
MMTRPDTASPSGLKAPLGTQTYPRRATSGEEYPRPHDKTPYTSLHNAPRSIHAWTDGSFRKSAGLGLIATPDPEGLGAPQPQDKRSLGDEANRLRRRYVPAFLTQFSEHYGHSTADSGARISLHHSFITHNPLIITPPHVASQPWAGQPSVVVLVGRGGGAEAS